MKILAYRGKSIYSRFIKLKTRSNISHVALELSSGEVIEAKVIAGVVLVKNFSTTHKPGTPVEVYEVPGVGAQEEAIMEAYARKQIGKKYDKRAILGFMFYKKQKPNDKWMCSEITFQTFLEGGIALLKRVQAAHVSPDDVRRSPLLRLTQSRTTL
jgi:hypothetical protein